MAVAEGPSVGFKTIEAPTTYTAMKKSRRSHMCRSASPMGKAGMPTGGHSSGGGTSSGGMAREAFYFNLDLAALISPREMKKDRAFMI